MSVEWMYAPIKEGPEVRCFIPVHENYIDALSKATSSRVSEREVFKLYKHKKKTVVVFDDQLKAELTTIGLPQKDMFYRDIWCIQITVKFETEDLANKLRELYRAKPMDNLSIEFTTGKNSWEYVYKEHSNSSI